VHSKYKISFSEQDRDVFKLTDHQTKDKEFFIEKLPISSRLTEDGLRLQSGVMMS
jgi:hypothetical protein